MIFYPGMHFGTCFNVLKVGTIWNNYEVSALYFGLTFLFVLYRELSIKLRNGCL